MAPRKLDPLKQSIVERAFAGFVNGEPIEDKNGNPGYTITRPKPTELQITVNNTPNGPRYFSVIVREMW